MEEDAGEAKPIRLWGGRPSLAEANPELAAEWDSGVNGKLTAEHVTKSSGRKVGWRCRAHRHQWAAAVHSRTNGNGCPVCAGKTVLPGFNDLASVNPQLAAEWDSDVNGALAATHVTVSSHRKVGWACQAYSHRWVAEVNSRTNGAGCPICAGQAVLRGFNDLASANPEIAAEWDDEANGDLKPWHVSGSSHRKVSWRCATHNHQWAVAVYHRAQGNGCPVCAGQSVLSGFNDLATVNPEIAAEWDNEANDELRPQHVTISSGRKVSWKCKPHGHPWVATVSARTNDRGCPVCAGQSVLSGFNDLATVNPELAAEWDNEANDELRPQHVTISSGRKVSWKCKPHGHPWVATVSARTNDRGCPVCAGQSVLSGFNDLATVNPELAAEWDNEANDELRPQHVTISSGRKVSWKCKPHGHPRVATVDKRTNGSGCPTCSLSQTSQIEKVFFEELARSLSNPVHGAKLKVAWGARKTSSVDIVGELDGHPVAVEYDGSHWHGAKLDKPGKRTRLSRDVEKTRALLAAGYLVVRIRENELPHLPIEHPDLRQISFTIPGMITDAKRAALVKPAVAKIMGWLEFRTSLSDAA